MKRLAFLLCFWSAFTSLSAEASEENLAHQAAAIDMAKVFTESKAVRDIQKQLKIKGDIFQKEIDLLENKARSEAEALEKEKDTLVQMTYTQRQEEIQKKVVTFQNLAIARKEQVDKAYTTAMDKVKDAFQQVMAQVASDRKIAIVFPIQQIVYMDQNLAMDITREVMQKLDKKLPRVAVVFPKEGKGY